MSQIRPEPDDATEVPGREAPWVRWLMIVAGAALVLAALLKLEARPEQEALSAALSHALIVLALLIVGAALVFVGWRKAPRRVRRAPQGPERLAAATVPVADREPAAAGKDGGSPRPGPGAISAADAILADWTWELDAQLRFIRHTPVPGATAQPALFDQIGQRPWEVPGILLPPANWEDHRADLQAGRPFRDVLVRRWDDEGLPHYLLLSGTPHFDAAGRCCGYHGVTKDVTEYALAHERMMRVATLDALTQLPNRQTFDERAAKILADADAQSQGLTLLFIDLDNFRILNNGYGYRIGDQVLALSAERLSNLLGESPLLGRRGGDEFVALLSGAMTLAQIAQAARSVIDAIAAPMTVLGMEVATSCSVGIALYPQDGATLRALLNAADAAICQAKQSGRKTLAFYTPGMARRVDLRHRLELKLRAAVRGQALRLHYQPMVSMTHGKVIGAEALVRWRDPELGEVPTIEFIEVAEESGLIIALGDWVLTEVCRMRQRWRSSGISLPPVAVNMSSVQLRQVGCFETLLDTLRRGDVAPHEIEVEVTETGLIDASAVTRDNLRRLSHAGVGVALDDFGVGFSSLAHLRDLPITRLKVDRTFTVECMRDARTLTIVRSVVDMARAMGIAVTAEGIETQAQHQWMQHLTCDSAQGFLYARPVPDDEFITVFLERQSKEKQGLVVATQE